MSPQTVTCGRFPRGTCKQTDVCMNFKVKFIEDMSVTFVKQEQGVMP